MLGGWDFFFPAFESGTYTKFRGEKKMNNTCTLEECGWSDMVEELGVDGVSLSLSLVVCIAKGKQERKLTSYCFLYIKINSSYAVKKEPPPPPPYPPTTSLSCPSFFFPLFPCSRTYAMCRSPPNSLMLNCLLDIIERGCAVSRC